MLELLLGLAAVTAALGWAARFAYNAGRADREVEKKVREAVDARVDAKIAEFSATMAEFGAKQAQMERRLELVEDEDATRRRQIHDLVEEFEEVIGPTHRERLVKLLQETSVVANAGPQSQRQRYGLNARQPEP